MYKNPQMLKFIIANQMCQLTKPVRDDIVNEIVDICGAVTNKLDSKYCDSSEGFEKFKGARYINQNIGEYMEFYISEEFKSLLLNDTSNQIINKLKSLLCGLINPIFYIPPVVDVKFHSNGMLSVKVMVKLKSQYVVPYWIN